MSALEKSIQIKTQRYQRFGRLQNPISPARSLGTRSDPGPLSKECTPDANFVPLGADDSTSLSFIWNFFYNLQNDCLYIYGLLFCWRHSSSTCPYIFVFETECSMWLDHRSPKIFAYRRGKRHLAAKTIRARANDEYL
jgi:hypothetical protein